MAVAPADLTDLRERFLSVYTAIVADVLDELGLLHQTLPSALVPLATGMKIAGPAFCCEGHPSEDVAYDQSMRKMLRWLEAVPPHAVAVYKGNDDRSSHFGDLSATTLISRGCAGVLVDGGCRDVELVLESGIPVFCRYRNPQDCVPRWDLLEWGHTVEIGGVRLAAGDWVLGDADGVVVIPAELRDEVLSKSESVVNTESEIRLAVQNGMAPTEAYDRYGIF